MSGNRIPYRRRQLYMKLISLFLVFSMCFGIVIIGDMSVSGEGDDQETDGGFSIDLKWSGDAVDDQVYDYDSDKKESRYVRLKVSYRNDCLLSDYDAGDIMIVVPGIDDAGRVPRIVPKAIAADMSTDLEKVYDWSYTYNQARNEYTFTNNGALTKDFVFEGMFEIIWEINSRETVNGYSKNISASLTTSQGEVATSNTIIYRQERYKDEYVFRDYDPTSKICSSEGIDNLIDRAGGKTSADYYFVKYSNFPYNFTRKSLGLTTYNEYTYDSLRSDWNVWLPAGVNLCGVDGKVNTDDAIFKKTGEVRTLEDGNQYECWTTKNKYATNTYGSGLTFYVAYPRDQFTGDATVRVEGVGRYRDDTADTIYAFKDYTVDVTNYEFRYEGDSFYATKRCYGVHNSYTDFHCGNCYSYGAVNAAHLSGGNYDYNSYLRFSLLDRRVSDDEKITLEIGDDILKVKTVNGTLRTLGDDEYHFSNVYIPSMAGFLNINDLKLQLKDYQAEIYVRIANSSSLVLYDTVTVGTAAKSVAFNRDDIVGVSVRIKDFDQTLKNFEIRLTHRFHTSAGDIQYLNGDGEFYNYMYIRLFDSEGNWINRIENNTNYPPNFDSQYDFDTYGGYLYRQSFMLHVLVIPSIINSYTNLSRVKQTKTSTMFNASDGMYLYLPGGNSLQKFSVYFILQEGMKVQDIYATPEKILDKIRFYGYRSDNDTELTNRFIKSHVDSITIDNNYIGDGRGRIAVHFDFSDDPLVNQSSQTSYFNINIEDVPLMVDIDTLRQQSGGSSLTTSRSYKYILRTCVVIDQNDFWSSEVDWELGNDIKQFCDVAVDDDTTVISYYDSTSTFVMADYAQLESLMSVKTGLTNGSVIPKYSGGVFSGVPYTYENEEYVYRLKFRSGQGISGNIVFVDALETDSETQWQGTFKEIDISNAEEKLGVTGTCYYSDIVVNKLEKPDFSDTSVWTTDSSTLDEVKSVAVIFDQGILEMGQSAFMEIKMKAPANENESLTDAITANSASIFYDTIDSITGQVVSQNSSLVLSNKVAIAMTPYLGKIKISKTDAYNNKPLKDVKFELYKRSSNPGVDDSLVADNIVTDSDGEAVINDVVYGEYYLKEISAPEGYVIPTDEVLVSHIHDAPDAVTTVEIANERKTTKVILQKESDKYSGTHPQGAKFMLYYADGRPYSNTPYTTNWQGKIELNLPWDSYYFIETQAPSGYILDPDNKTEFTIKPNGKLDTGEDEYYEEESEQEQSNEIVLEVVNQQKSASIKLRKYEMLEDGTTTTVPIGGAAYQLFRENGTPLGTYITDSNGEIIVSDVAIGNYYFVEKIAAQGYQLNKEKVEVKVTAWSLNTVCTTYDKRKTGVLWLEKKDNEGELVANAEYGLFKSDGTQVDNEGKPSSVVYRTDSSGSLTISDLWWGDYYVKELNSPTGYELNDTHYDFSVGKTTVRTYIKRSAVDNRILGKVQLKKTDAATGTKKLEGAKYDLYKGDGTLYMKDITTDEEGEAPLIENIPWGSYYFLETKAPDGYSLSDEKVRFSVNYLSAGKVQEIIAEDKELSGNITVTKKIKIDDAVFAHGNPTFVFKLNGEDMDGKTYTAYKSVTFSKDYVDSFMAIGEEYVSLDVTFTEIPIGTFRVSEESTIRYDNDKNSIETSGTVNSDGSVTIELSGDNEDTLSGHVTFINEKTVQSGTSSAGQEQNIIKRKSKVTSISVVWRGDEYLPDPHIYPSDLDVYVVYDDGTTERLNRSDYDLYVGDDLIDGSYVGDLTSGTYVVTVQYGNNDNTSRLFKDSFEVKVAPPTAFTYEVTKQKITVDGVTYDGTAMITGFLGNTSIINIPETVEGTNTLVNYFEGGTRRGYNNDEYLVVGIKGYYYSSDLTAEGAYASCAYGFKDATMVEIPDSVTIIGDAAFKNCTDLESLDLTNITEIGDYAFYGCTSLDLTDLELPNLTKIGDYGFSKVTQIQSLRLTSIQYVGDYAFAGCEGITFDGEGVLGEMGDDYWTLSNGRTYLAYWTDQVTFGTYNPNWASGVVYSPMLGRDVFYDTPLYNAAKEHCEGNDDFVLVYTDSNCSILSSFLYDKTKIDYSQLTSSDIIYGTEDSYYNMYIYTQTQSIAAYTFYNCDFITGVYCSYPYAYSNVITVGDYAFSGCYRIHYMFDSSTTEFIQDLETGEVSDSWYSGVIYRLGKNPFHGCLGLARYEKIPEGVSFISRSEYIPYVYDTDRDDSFVVSDAISDIYNYNCSIYMLDSVKDIEEYTFYCANLNQVRLPDGLKKINDGVFRNASFNYWEEYYLPDSITEIGDYAFYDASFMMKLNLPKKLEYVGDYAFYQCYGLWGNDDVELPSGITHIGENAFNNCQIRGDIELPEKLSYLGDYAFHYNGGLISVKIPGSVTNIGKHVFSNCGGLQSVVIEDGVKTIGPYAFAYCTNLTTVTIPDSVTYIDPTAFTGCNKLLSGSGVGESVVVDGITYSGDMKVLLSCPPYQSGDVVVPDGVTEIADQAFKGCWNVSSITLPDSVKRIGDYSFSGCSKITSLTLPDGLTSIGDYAFSSCSRLQSMSIPNSVTSIGVNVLSSCVVLESVTLPDNMKSIPDYTFSACKKLNNVTIPDGVTIIGASAFDGCSVLADVEIPDSVTSIENSAFGSCSAFKNITIPDSVKNLGQSVFYNCTKLESVVLPKKIDSMGSNFFRGCVKLTSVKVTGGTENTLPEGSINMDYFFNGCTSLQSMVMPDGITKLGYYMFGGCTGLESITIPDSFNSYYNSLNAFYNCNSLTEINISPECLCKLTSSNIFDSTGLYKNAPNNSYVYVGETLYKYKGTLPANTEVTLGEGVKGIAYYAFNNNKNIVSVSGPDVEYIGGYAFSGCSNLSSISFDNLRYIGDNAFSSTAALSFSAGENYIGNVFYKYIGSMPADTEITILDGTTQIAPSAFYGFANLADIHIPESVTEIGSSAFYNCKGLTEVTLPDSIKTINSSTFSGCTNLESVSIPSALEKIGVNSLSGTKITSIELPETTKYIEDNAFNNCKYLTSVTLPSKSSNLGQGAFRGCSSLTSVNLPEGITNLSNYLFYGCSSLESVDIPDGVITISNSVFNGCSSLESVVIPDSVRNFGGSVFSGCSSLKNVNIPSSITYIPFSTFSGCTSLESIVIPDNIVRIYDYAFSGCISLENITFSGMLNNIGPYAFNRCRSLTNIELPGTLQNIEKSAFDGCSALTSIELPNSVVSIGDSAFADCTSLEVFTVPDNIRELSDSILRGCSSLREVVLAENTVSIGSYSFCDCVSLTTINIPETVKSIGDYAFYNCSLLSELTIPEDIEYLGALAFDGTAWFIKESSGSDIIYIGDTLYKCNSLSDNSVRIRSGTVGISGGAFRDMTGLEFIFIPDSVKVIGNYAFDGCTNLQNVYNADGSVGVGKNVTSIGEYAFRNTDLSYLIMPEVRDVGRYAFYGNNDLKVLIMPNVDTIGTVCKVDYEKYYDIDSDVEYMLESYTFSGCVDIRIISMPSVRRIGNGAFTDSVLVFDSDYEQSGYLILPETLRDLSPFTNYMSPACYYNEFSPFYDFGHLSGAIYVPNSWIKYWCNIHSDDNNSNWYFDNYSYQYWYFDSYNDMRCTLALWNSDIMGYADDFYDEYYYEKYTSDYYNRFGSGCDYAENCGLTYFYDNPTEIMDNLTRRYAG